MISNHRELKKIEQRFLDLIKPIEFGARYYNFSSRAFGADPVKASEWMKGNKNNLGKKLSENARKKISDFHKGRPQPEWLKIKSGLAKRGRKWHTNGSEESLCKICPDGWVRGRSAAYIKIVRERIYDASHGEKISAAKLASGYTHSMETRKKISTTKRARFEAANIT